MRLAGAQTVGTSLKPSWIKDEGDGSWTITLPRDWREPFEALDFEIAANAPAIALPRIDGNQGREGEFQIREPVEARITASAQGLQSGLPDSRLPPALRATAGVVGVYARLAEGALTLAIERFDAVSAPAMVLDAIHLYVSFSDNGAALSVLRLELPAQAGQKLEIKPIAGAEVWSLTVNGEPRSPVRPAVRPVGDPARRGQEGFSGGAGVSAKGEKLGLKGRLEVAAPATGLAARRRTSPSRWPNGVELVAIEGDLEPARGALAAKSRALPVCSSAVSSRRGAERRHFLQRTARPQQGETLMSIRYILAVIAIFLLRRRHWFILGTASMVVRCVFLRPRPVRWPGCGANPSCSPRPNCRSRCRGRNRCVPCARTPT
ncbi:MAG: hypothetical protein U1F68_10750 [Gammaproteobacteria bacterium]